MNISLPDQMKEWVETQAKSGKYGNASDQERAEAREKLQQLVDDALASGITNIGRDELMERVIGKAREALQSKKSA
jgi:antitoxin ParD1/3/4